MSFSVHVAGDGAGWAIDEEASHLRRTLATLKIREVASRWKPSTLIYHCDRYRALKSLAWGEKFLHPQLALDYFHGRPENGSSFVELIERMRRYQPSIDRVRVSTALMEHFLESEGFEGKVQRIPIGVDVSRFSLVSEDKRKAAREFLSIPHQSVVVGSFQKDGDGWVEGNVPKHIKGPDILVQTCIALARAVPNLLVLLAGPSRGYVESELSKQRINFVRLPYVARDLLPILYHAIDLYVVSSREEGGPKAFLEAMASGIPLVSTPVGQVVDLATQNQASVADGFEPSELADRGLELLANASDNSQRLRRRALAKDHSLESQTAEWKKFFSSLTSRSRDSHPHRRQWY